MYKTITMSVGEILSAYELLTNFIRKDISLPGKISWVISDNMDELEKTVEKYKIKQTQIGQRYVTEGKTIKNDEGNEVISPEFITDYTNSVKEILSINRHLDIELITSDELRHIEGLSVLDIKALDFMLEKEVNAHEKDSIG